MRKRSLFAGIILAGLLLVSFAPLASAAGSGSVKAWGNNNYGQLGDGTTTDSLVPVDVSGLTGVLAIAGGYDDFTVALKSDGTVWAWGYNYYGQLGDGTTAYSIAPVQVKGVGGSGFLTDVVAVSGGYQHSAALKSDGTVWAWGRNSNGQLGDGTTDNSSTPVPVSGLNGVIAIACGYDHTVALKSDGTVWAWGRNPYGQVGDNTTTTRTEPVQVKGVGGTGFLTGVTAIAGGAYHTVALKSDGTVWAWGYNAYTQLGDGSVTSRNAPVQVRDSDDPTGYLTGITAIAGGSNHTVALKSDGTVWAWGNNGYGQLGDGTTTQPNAPPVLVSGLTGVTGVNCGAQYSVAFKSDGTAWAWGNNSGGQLGDGTTTNSSVPVQVSGLTGVIAVAAGARSTYAIKTEAVIAEAWGYNGNGQLGDGTTTDSSTPVPAFGLVGVKEVGGGRYYSVAVKSDGTAWAWGNNDSGQVGDGTTTDRTAPVQVSGVSGVIAVAGGGNHSVALKSDGTVCAWGSDGWGQLGDGPTNSSGSTPVQVSGLSDVAAVKAGYQHTVALKSDGTVWAWGLNAYGQLGNNSTTYSNEPVQVSGPGGTGFLTDVAAIACGHFHTIAVKSDGTVWSWGYNASTQLGDGSATSRNAPVQVRDSDDPTGYLTGVTAVAGGYGHSAVLKSDGTVWAWGNNSYGQLGDNTTTNSSAPVQVKGAGGTGFLTGIAAIEGGSYNVVALKSDGTAWDWGIVNNSHTPVQVSGLAGVTEIGAGEFHSVASAPAQDGMAIMFTQNAKALTLKAMGFSGGAPISGQTIKFYRSKYILTSDTWSRWGSAGTAVADITGTATRTFSIGYGTYRFKAVYAPAGAAAVESDPTSDCVIWPVIALTPLTKAVGTDNTPAATWTAFTGAAGYVIQTCTTKKFIEGVTETADLGPVTTGDLPELARGVKTFWRVIALLPTGRSVPSKPWLVLYKEAAELTGLSANKDGMTIRPSATLSGVEAGALAGKKVYFYYIGGTSDRWLSAGYGITDGAGFAQPAAPKTLPAAGIPYYVKAYFKTDTAYYTSETEPVSFTLP